MSASSSSDRASAWGLARPSPTPSPSTPPARALRAAGRGTQTMSATVTQTTRQDWAECAHPPLTRLLACRTRDPRQLTRSLWSRLQCVNCVENYASYAAGDFVWDGGAVTGGVWISRPFPSSPRFIHLWTRPSDPHSSSHRVHGQVLPSGRVGVAGLGLAHPDVHSARTRSPSTASRSSATVTGNNAAASPATTSVCGSLARLVLCI